MLATTGGRERLAAAHARQLEHGAAIALLSHKALSRRFPWLRTDDVEAACLRQGGEGWFDQNAIIGPHPEISNFLFACGFSGHGVMHAPAAGRGLADLLTTGAYRTINLLPFRYDRMQTGKRLDDIQPSEDRKISAGV